MTDWVEVSATVFLGIATLVLAVISYTVLKKSLLHNQDVLEVNKKLLKINQEEIAMNREMIADNKKTTILKVRDRKPKFMLKRRPILYQHESGLEIKFDLINIGGQPAYIKEIDIFASIEEKNIFAYPTNAVIDKIIRPDAEIEIKWQLEKIEINENEEYPQIENDISDFEISFECIHADDVDNKKAGTYSFFIRDDLDFVDKTASFEGGCRWAAYNQHPHRETYNKFPEIERYKKLMNLLYDNETIDWSEVIKLIEEEDE